MYSKAKKAFKDAMLTNPTNPGIFAGLGILAHLDKDLDKAIEYFHKALQLEPDNPRYLELLDSVLDDLANFDPIKIIQPSYVNEAKSKHLHKYFENESDNSQSLSIVRKQLVTSKKEITTPRKLAGVRTRSQTKNIPSDPFTDPFVDNSPSRLQSSELFISSFKTRLFNQPLEESSPSNPSKRLDFFGIDSNIAPSGNSSFSFSPLGLSDPTPLFFPPAREPSSLSGFNRQIDSDEVDMEIDDL